MILREYRLEDRVMVDDILRRQCLRIAGKPPVASAMQMDDPNQCIRAVIVQDGGRVVGALTGTLRLEVGLVIDPADFEGPASCWGWIMRAFARFAGIAYSLGIKTVYARVNNKRFASRIIQKLGFKRSDSPHLYFDLGAGQ